jgi:Domain of unknown function (DUF5619)
MVEPLQKIISVRIDASPQDIFSASRTAAAEALEEQNINAVLISWKNNLTGESSPQVESCRCGFEGWELYALTRGATLRVEINGGQIVFLFMPVEEDEFTAF